MPFSAVVKSSGTIQSTENLPIRYDTYVPVGSKRPIPVVLFLHGFKGFKDWGPFPDACEEIARSGFMVVAFNFSRNGVGESLTEFDELELFAGETFSQDLDDVGSVIEALQSGKIATEKAEVNTDWIGIVGHSRGGHTAVAAAAEYEDIDCLVTWSAVADYNQRWTDEMIADWESRGYTEIVNSRTGQKMRIDKVVYEDAKENADRVIALNRVKELRLPALFIHGQRDESVAKIETELLYRTCPSDEKELRLIANTGHTFGGSHPFEEQDFPEPFAEVLNATIGWFEYYLEP